MTPLHNILNRVSWSFKNVVQVDWLRDKYLVLDLAESNQLLHQNIANTSQFHNFIVGQIVEANAIAAVGGYNEDRVIYRRSEHFSGEEPRTIHLGIDIWMPAGTPVFAPIAGHIHSFQDNARFGDYGPTIIMEHQLKDITFYILYGHLSRSSLQELYEKKSIAAGEQVGEIGDFPENGDWPPHLHFQMMTDMLGLKGDFPGVAAASQRDYYLQICPNPNLILRIPGL